MLKMFVKLLNGWREAFWPKIKKSSRKLLKSPYFLVNDQKVWLSVELFVCFAQRLVVLFECQVKIQTHP